MAGRKERFPERELPRIKAEMLCCTLMCLRIERLGESSLDCVGEPKVPYGIASVTDHWSSRRGCLWVSPRVVPVRNTLLIVEHRRPRNGGGVSEWQRIEQHLAVLRHARGKAAFDDPTRVIRRIIVVDPRMPASNNGELEPLRFDSLDVEGRASAEAVLLRSAWELFGFVNEWRRLHLWTEGDWGDLEKSLAENLVLEPSKVSGLFEEEQIAQGISVRGRVGENYIPREIPRRRDVLCQGRQGNARPGWEATGSDGSIVLWRR